MGGWGGGGGGGGKGDWAIIYGMGYQHSKLERWGILLYIWQKLGIPP